MTSSEAEAETVLARELAADRLLQRLGAVHRRIFRLPPLGRRIRRLDRVRRRGEIGFPDSKRDDRRALLPQRPHPRHHLIRRSDPGPAQAPGQRRHQASPSQKRRMRVHASRRFSVLVA